MVLVVREILVFGQFSGLFAKRPPPFALAAHRRIRTHQAASWSDFGSLVVRARMEDKFKNLVFWSKVTSGWPVLSLEFRFQAKPVEQKYKHKRSSQARAARPWPGCDCEAIVYTHLYATLLAAERLLVLYTLSGVE